MMRIISIEICGILFYIFFSGSRDSRCFRILDWMDKNFRTIITSPATMTAGVSASAR